MDAVAVAVGHIDVVGSRPGDHDRVSLPVDETVVARAAMETIVAAAAADEVMAAAADDPVMATAAVDQVVPMAAVQPIVAAEAVDQVVATAAVHAAAGPAGAELVVAVTADDPLTRRQPEHEIDPAGHPHNPRPRHTRHLRVAANQRPRIEPQQPARQSLPGRPRLRVLQRHTSGRPHTGHHRRTPQPASVSSAGKQTRASKTPRGSGGIRCWCSAA